MKRFLILHVFGALLGTIAQGMTNFELAAKATNELGVDLHRQLATGDENLCISPYSIDSALVMTFAGSDGETRTEMARVLHFATGGDVPASFSALQKSLEEMSAKTAELAKNSKKFGGPSEPITLHIANRLFAQKGYHFRETFLSLVKQNFGGLAEIRQDKKVRDREAAIASTRAACAPRKVSRRNIHPSSVSSSG